MLTRVTVGQVRFNLGGLAPDARGVATGKELCIRFATLDRLVGFLRLLSAERLPDEVWSTMTVFYARPTGGGREVLARLAHPTGETGDAVAATARLGGGLAFTGTGRHFVPTREARAPLGYDVVTVPHEDGDLMVITSEGVTAFRQEGTLALERLILRLELRRLPGGAAAALRDNEGQPVIVTARRGLAPLLMQLFSREGISARAALVEPQQTGPFSSATTTWLFRINNLPARLAGLCTRTPGIGLYLPVVDDVLCAAGWQHPIHLEGAHAALPGDRLLLFAPPPAAPLEIAPRPNFVALTDLMSIELMRGPTAAGPSHAVPLEAGDDRQALVVPLRLEPLGFGPARVRAVLVPWTQAPWLRRLLFALPAAALRGYRVAFVEAGVLILGAEHIDNLPFGQPLEEAQPGLFVPVGFRVRPALSADLLALRLGILEGVMCIFPARGAPPFRIAGSSFEPLERKALARIDVPWAAPPGGRSLAMLAADPAAAPEIENQPLGLLPLWGWRSKRPES